MTEEIRTTSSTGGEKGVKKERFSLLPRRGLEAIARVFGFGAQKYADHNWRRGYEWSKSIDALERHVQAFKDGETFDEESGEPHLAHAGFHVLVLLTWLHDQGEGADNPMDDRWPAGMERARRAAVEAEQESDAAAEALEDFHVPPSPPSHGPDLLRKHKINLTAQIDDGLETAGRAICRELDAAQRQRLRIPAF